MNEPARSTPPESFGRYLLYPAIARGGMATVHTARLVGVEGFSRLFAAKRLHPQFTEEPDFVTMFHDEACIASHIHHPNVVPVLDVVVAGTELILVQEYVHGVPLNQLLRGPLRGDAPLPIDIVIAVLTGVLAGLHAAHEARDEADRPLEIVHRDVSPQNVMVSVDGIPRLLDFGIAKARTSTHHTREGVFKGKLAYMAPEQLRMEGIDRTVDIYATGVLAWEMLVNRRINEGLHEMAFVTTLMCQEIPSVIEALANTRDRVDEQRWRDLVALDAIVRRAMSHDIEERYATADEMLSALLQVRAGATSIAVGQWVRSAGADFLEQRQRTLAANEESWRRTCLSTPSSGTQRTAGAMVARDPQSPSGESSGPHEATSAAVIIGPRSMALPLGVHAPRTPNESGAYRAAVGVPPLARLAGAMRSSPIIWSLVALAVIVAGLAVSLAGGGESARGVRSPIAVQVPAAPVAPPSPIAEGPRSDVTLPIASGPTSAAAPAAPPPAVSARVVARPPAPPVPPRQPHAVWSPRAASTTHAASGGPGGASRAAPGASKSDSKTDCNPPFFFEGTKKIFKTSCL